MEQSNRGQVGAVTRPRASTVGMRQRANTQSGNSKSSTYTIGKVLKYSAVLRHLKAHFIYLLVCLFIYFRSVMRPARLKEVKNSHSHTHLAPTAQAQPPPISMFTPSWACVTVDKPTLKYYYPDPTFHIQEHCWCYEVYGFGHMYNGMYPLL